MSNEMSDDARRSRSEWGKVGAHEAWANCLDRTERTAPARAALEQTFLDQADGDPVRAAHKRKAHYARLAVLSAQARRRRARGQADAAAVADDAALAAELLEAANLLTAGGEQ